MSFFRALSWCSLAALANNNTFAVQLKVTITKRNLRKIMNIQTAHSSGATMYSLNHQLDDTAVSTAVIPLVKQSERAAAPRESYCSRGSNMREHMAGSFNHYAETRLFSSPLTLSLFSFRVV